ncbi:PAS domain S-box protein [Caldimonas sp. KR1-144]|uniref:PAS domain S-box protein n=1 Tax=Caldimonas sp. KR1-144 TaxID=3400911 RepID=UPI003BFB5D3B
MNRVGPPIRFLSPPDVIDVATARAFLRVAAWVAGAGGLVLTLNYPDFTLGQRGIAGAAAAALGVAFAWAARRGEAALGWAAFATLAGLELTVLALAIFTRLGVHAMVLAGVGVLLAVAGTLLERRHAWALAGLALVSLPGLAWLDPGAVMPSPPGYSAELSWQRTLALLLITLFGAATGEVLGTLLRRQLAASREQQQRWQRLFARSPTAIVIHRAGRIVMVNDAAVRLFGFASQADAVDRDLMRHYLDEDLLQIRERIARIDALPADQQLASAEFRVRRTDGTLRWVTVTGSRVMLDDGPAVESVYLDVGELRERERRMLRSEALLSRLFEASPNSVSVTAVATGRYLMVNRAYELISGRTREETVGRTSTELGIWADAATRAAILGAIERDGELRDLPVRFRHKQGHILLLGLSGAFFDFEGERCLVTMARDLTDQERERRETRAILDAASVGIAFTRERRFLRVNPHFEAMFGWPAGEIVGQPGLAVWPGDAAYAAIGAEFGPRLAAGETVEFEREMRRRDDSRFVARVLAQPVDRADAASGTIWIVEDVTERRRVAAQLEQALGDAQAANRAKSAFLANMSHEIRTPLNGVVGLAQLARQPGTASAVRDAYLLQLVDSAQHLSAVISDVLDLSKIEAGRLTVSAVAFDLPALLDSVRATHAPVAQQRGLALTAQLDERLPRRVRGDDMRLRQILSNYLGNALKFTESGSVTLQARPVSGERVRFTVVDTGPGVAETARARLFQPFVQADDSATRLHGGTGLGLAICRELAELMGGSVGHEQPAAGGSAFWLELPLAPLADEARADDAGVGLPEDAASLAGLRVLVVEDHAVNLLIARAMLERWGAVVTEAANGEAALAAVERESSAGHPGFDLVLMDVHMPVLGGVEATRRLRTRWSAQQLPIVALTAAALVEEQERVLAVGMNDFLAKPLDARKLHATAARYRRAPAPLSSS